MRAALATLAVAVLLVVAATALFSGAQRRGGEARLLEPGATSFDATVLSFDATPIAITVYRPAGASADAPVPVVLHSHGWAGTRTVDGGGLVGRLWGDGFGVVSIDARGHGESGGRSTIHHKDVEVKDFQAVLDWIHDELDWVEKETRSGVPKDVVAGGAGYSYGGAFQLMTASYDARLDAIAPEITWSSLPDALAPNGVPKSLWLDFLVGDARTSGTRVDQRLYEWHEQALLTGELPPEALEHLAGSSPVLADVWADVLLVQGLSDTLFPLNEAMRAYDALDGGTADVRLFTHLTGHVAPYAQPFGTSAQRRDAFQDAGPCGSTQDVVARWLSERLRGGAPSGVPEVSYAMEDGSCVTLSERPTTAIDARAALGAAPSAAGTVLVPLAEGPLVVAGVPHLRAQVDARTTGGIAFVSLAVVGADGFTRVVNDQSMPIRATPGAAIDAEMAGVATTLGAGDRLLLRIDGLNEWYAHNAARTPGASVLHDIVVTLPVIL